ncbi:MAG: hypothetical protein ACRBN8_39805 [Nannocystales bacterium]
MTRYADEVAAQSVERVFELHYGAEQSEGRPIRSGDDSEQEPQHRLDAVHGACGNPAHAKG